MSTRGAIGFRYKGQDKVTYNHSDSYPESLGIDILHYAQKHSISEMITQFDSIILVDSNSTPTPADIEQYRSVANTGVSKQSLEDWYCLLRDQQGSLDVKHMIDQRGFLADSLFCEWAYIINLDEQVLEVYKGFNKNRYAPGRYAHLRPDFDEIGDYFGVRLIMVIPLGFVTTVDDDEFCSLCKPKED